MAGGAGRAGRDGGVAAGACEMVPTWCSASGRNEAIFRVEQENVQGARTVRRGEARSVDRATTGTNFAFQNQEKLTPASQKRFF